MSKPREFSMPRDARRSGRGMDSFAEFAEAERSESAWAAVLESSSPVEEEEAAPVDYTGDADFSKRGKYSGVGVLAEDDPADFDPEPAPSSARESRRAFDPSTFRELYRSRDGRFCFYEDAKTGHLAAVDASKLA